MNKLRVIFVHGISSAIIKGDYTKELCDLLRSRLTAIGVLPPNASDDQIAEIITFEAVNYSAIGQAEEDQVLAAYRSERDRLYSLPDEVLERIAFDTLRAQMITSVSDVLVYESTHWRDQIRGLVKAKLDQYVGSGDAVSLVAHSLGSVVAFDTAHYNSRHDPTWLKAAFKPTNLFTMGSPIALFSLELDDTTGEQKPRYVPASVGGAVDVGGDMQPNLSDGVWYNFLDAQDLIGYPLETLFAGKFQVKDIRVETGTFPISAHTGYWKNAVVAEEIAQRLKLDFARINVPVAAAS